MAGTVRSNVLWNSRFDESLYHKVLSACALETDLASKPQGDLTEITSAGTTLSGGQRARVGLARAVYRAALDVQSSAGERPPLVLLDDPFCALDRQVTLEVARALFKQPAGLLAQCAVVTTTSNPWWLSQWNDVATRVVVLRQGRIQASGPLKELHRLHLKELSPAFEESVVPQPGLASSASEIGSATVTGDGDGDSVSPSTSDAEEKPAERGKLVKSEHRQAGMVSFQTYLDYLNKIGPITILTLGASLIGIMVFQSLTTLWITYWSDEDPTSNFIYPYLLFFWDPVPTGSTFLLDVYLVLVLVYILMNFAGHLLEAVGAIRAARALFVKALLGTFGRPFRWWDSNPTGRVLNRFSEDVDVVDQGITSIFGVIFGAVLYFLGHVFILALANPWSLALLPLIMVLFEFMARYYRSSIREIHRIWLVSMSLMYETMVEAIVFKVTVRSFAATHSVICRSLCVLEQFQQISFMKEVLAEWIGLRMNLVGYSLTAVNTLYPVLQYAGLLVPRSAALVGFSISYSQQCSAIIQQFVMNFSAMEMQLVSVERLNEYETLEIVAASAVFHETVQDNQPKRLELRNVTVNYGKGLPAALEVSLHFAAGEVCAITGRTGAGKSSLLLAVLQLVPYTGSIVIDGVCLQNLDPRDVRRNLVGVVPQQPVIFSGSLRWNLDPDRASSDDALWEVLSAVGLRQTMTHDAGLDVMLSSSANGGEGAVKNEDNSSLTLSQGQRQLLCAARALLRFPRVALLDEVTSCMPSNEASGTIETLTARFKEMDASVLLITHQEEVLSACDRVVQIAAGRLVADSRASV